VSTAPRCIPIADAHGVNAGGKAEGLASLSALGLPVPDGFVILDPTPESLPDDLELAYDRIERGRARVALTLTEASEVQPDEILIVPVIDVGWTPAFATIRGFASDVGGALSHGAVVAREYGIPTLVNLHNATRTFHTGDLVELDADHGVLRRIPEG
jgi:phosphoenolpyruvate synthase/pyruvate phosphate dikinase